MAQSAVVRHLSRLADTRPAEANAGHRRKPRPIEHPTRQRWVEGVKIETAPYRELRARKLEATAKERERNGVWRRVTRREREAGEVTTRPGRSERLADLVTREVRTKRGTRLEWRQFSGRAHGVSEHAVEANGRWHRARATGKRECFERVKDCGLVNTIHVLCPSCGSQHEQAAGCGSRTMCLTCRGRQNARKRREFLASRAVVLRRAHEIGVDDPRRRPGAFTEKFLTPTLPHLREHNVTDRINLAFRAWPFFNRSLNAWLEAHPDPAARECVFWYRHFECEPGDDEQGHPHFHLWFFGPFLPARPEDGLLLQRWWCDALDAAARDLGIVEPRIAPDAIQFDVQAKLHDVEQELIKYLVKEVTKTGTYVSPAWYARLFEALDGRRVTQPSKGFIALGRDGVERACRDCWNVVDRFKVAVRVNPAFQFSGDSNGRPNGASDDGHTREAGPSAREGTP
jgi:hypothetical protein